ISAEESVDGSVPSPPASDRASPRTSSGRASAASAVPSETKIAAAAVRGDTNRMYGLQRKRIGRGGRPPDRVRHTEGGGEVPHLVRGDAHPRPPPHHSRGGPPGKGAPRARPWLSTP